MVGLAWGHVPVSGARDRDQDSPKHYAPSVEGVIPQRKIGVLLPEEGVDSGQSTQQTSTTHWAEKSTVNQSPGF